MAGLGVFDDPMLGMAAGYFANRGPGSSSMQALGGGMQTAMQMQMMKNREQRQEKALDAQLKADEQKLKTLERQKKFAEQAQNLAIQNGYSETDALGAYEAALSGKTTDALQIATQGLAGAQLTGEVANINALRSQEGLPPMTVGDYQKYKTDLARAGATNVQVDTGPKMPPAYTWNAELGRAEVVPGLEGKAFSEGQRAAASYVGRMAEATGRMASAVDAGAEPGSGMQHFFAAVPMVGNYLTGTDFKLYKQAQEDWVRAKLRKESGAVIAREEMDNEIQTYFPMPGDPPEVIEQKRRARETAENVLRQESAGAYTAPATPGAPVVESETSVTVTPLRRRYDPATGQWQ